ncbi:MAG TPA: adenylyl-sulfate kinase [Bacteroidetes bacterium]|nr:adenylyl-sulfate kinase [Bacteroidota bacterium]
MNKRSDKNLPVVVWLTGLSGAGKTTIAKELVKRFKKKNISVEFLDGDIIRNIFPQTGFTREERDRHIKRIGFLAGILEKNGISVVASFISPYQEARDFVRNNCKNFFEIYVSTPLEECERRDVKNLYARARAGEIRHFTGIDDPYEVPEKPDLTIDTTGKSVEACVNVIMDKLGI